MATEPTMPDTNKALVRRWFEQVWNGRDGGAIEALAAEDFVLHHFSMPAPIDRPTYAQFHPLFMAAFPDFQIAVDDLIAEGDRVTARVTQSATHQGDLMGIAPTGKRVTLPGIAIYRIAEGKIAEAWAAETAWTQVLAEAAATPA
ncbi:MAG TPA: ester cyclase [Herpetosiphonaceae bacterium]|nr:ester cyclase [Herpetosiphonaceae bacterium]